MSDISGISFGQMFPGAGVPGNMSAAQASSGYAGPAAYSQNYLNNLFANIQRSEQETANRITSSATALAAWTPNTFNMSNAGTGLTIPQLQGPATSFPGLGASPYRTTPNVFETGASPFFGGGGSSGLGGSLYGDGMPQPQYTGPTIDWGGVGRAAADFGPGSGGSYSPGGLSSLGGLGGAPYTPGGPALDWTHLFGGGTRNDPYPGMAMPGGLGAPMVTPLQQPSDLGSLAGRGMGGTSGAPETPQPGAPGPPEGRLSSLGGLGGAPYTPLPGGSSLDWTHLFGGGGSRAQAEPLQAPEQATRPGAPAAPRTYDLAPMFEGGGGGGFGTGGSDTQLYGAPGAGSLGGAFDYVSPSGGALTPGGGLPAADLAAQARGRLAELMGGTGTPTGRTAESAREAGGAVIPPPAADTADLPLSAPRPGQQASAVPEVQLPGEAGRGGMVGRPAVTAADVPRPPADIPERADMSIPGRVDIIRNTIQKELEAQDLVMTSGYRGPEHELYRPGSAHGQGLAFDTRARTPEQADAAMNKIRELFAARGMVEGRGGDYFFIDEVRNPIAGITKGAHLHTTLTPQGMQKYQEQAFRDPYPNAAPRPPADVPVPIPPAGPAAASAEAQPSESRVNQGQNVSPPSANIPDPRVVGGGFNALDAAAGPSGVERAQTFLNRSVESILQQHSPENLGRAGFVMDIKQPLREALKGPFGGAILSGLQPKLGTLGLTQSDFARAVADPRARFGGGFGESGMGGALPSAGAFTPFADFRQSPNVENRTAEQLGREQLAQLQTRGFGYEPGPEVAPTPLGSALGLEDLQRPANVIGPQTSAFGFEPGGFGEGGYAPFQPAEAPGEPRLITERAPSQAAEEKWLKYGGVGAAETGPPKYSGFEQPYGPQFQPGEYMRKQFENRADYTLQDQAERLAGQRERAGAQITADPELRRNTIATVLAEMGENQTDENRLKVIESFLNRLSANKDVRGPPADYSQGMYKMLGYRDAAGREAGPEGNPIQRTNRGQYYEPFRYGRQGEAPAVIARGYEVMQRNPALAEHVGALLDAAIKTGTNVSNLTTENSSDPISSRQLRLGLQSPNEWAAIPGSAPELFSRKDVSTPAAREEHGSPAVYRNWLAGLMPTGWQWEPQPRSSIPGLPPRWR